MFKRGFSAVETERTRQETERKRREGSLFRFMLLEDKGEAQVRFLTEEPISFCEHNVKELRGGKEIYRPVFCAGKDCPLCKKGDSPSFKSAFLVVDRRTRTYIDKKTQQEKTISNQVRLFVQGVRVVSQLERISSRYGLSNREVTIIRQGLGQNTSYIVERGETAPITPEEVASLLPESLRIHYNGTMESLYDIVEKQISGEFNEEEETEGSDATKKTTEAAGVIPVEDIPSAQTTEQMPLNRVKLFKKN